MFTDDDVDDILIRAAVNADDNRAVTDLHDTEQHESSMKHEDETEFELALKLSGELYHTRADSNPPPEHIHLNSSSASDVVEFDKDEDFEFALKLSKELNDQDLPASRENSSNNSTSNTVMFDEDADFKLALKLFEEENNSLQKNDSPLTSRRGSNSTSNVMKFDEDKDFELALKLSAELNGPPINLPASSRPSSSTVLFDDDQDFELAVKLSLEKSGPSVNLPSSSHSASSTVPFDDDQDFALALKLSTELNNSPQTNVSPVARKESQRSSAKPVHTVPVYDVENDVIIEKVVQNIIASHGIQVLGQSSTKSPTNSRMPTENTESVKKYLNKDISVVDPSWETIDPNPDIHAMFVAFNKRFFWGQLGMVEVKWSPRMTLCAGNCTYKRMAGHCIVNLSKPLLQLRPRKDLVETLLHEMIHAYLFVSHNDRDRDGHGPRFHSHMYRINKESGAHISVYHNFHDEVKYYKQHEWRCNGPCRDRPPFYGYVRRSMNRAPGPYDKWWDDHAARCTGQFVKTKEPEGYANKKTASESRNALGVENKGSTYDIENFFKTKSSKSSTSGSSKRPASSPSSAQPVKFLAGSKSVATNVAVNTSSAGPRIFTITDLSNDRSASRNGQSQSSSPKKWVPLRQQGNIRHFFDKS